MQTIGFWFASCTIALVGLVALPACDADCAEKLACGPFALEDTSSSTTGAGVGGSGARGGAGGTGEGGGAGMGQGAAIAIDVGTGHACALLADGLVRCWGGNTFGELGNGTMTDSTVPVTVQAITAAVEISAGGNATCARLQSGVVR